jgi:hypothetical protein
VCHAYLESYCCGYFWWAAAQSCAEVQLLLAQPRSCRCVVCCCCLSHQLLQGLQLLFLQLLPLLWWQGMVKHLPADHHQLPADSTAPQTQQNQHTKHELLNGTNVCFIDV